jgi:hypothetical protein
MARKLVACAASDLEQAERQRRIAHSTDLIITSRWRVHFAAGEFFSAGFLARTGIMC